MIRVSNREFDAPRGRSADRRGSPQPGDEGGGDSGRADAGVQRAPQQHELHPSGHPRGSGQARRAPLRSMPSQRGSGMRAQVSQADVSATRMIAIAQRRPRVAQRVIRGSIEAPQRRGQQSDRRAGKDAPDVDRVVVRELARSDRAPRRSTSPSARKAIAEGTMKNAIWRSPAFSRWRRRAATRPVPSALDIAGSSAADTAMPNRLTGSV